MRHGFIKVAALTPQVAVADVIQNTKNICQMLDEAAEAGAKIMVFPELSITGYTCGDLFYQDLLLAQAREALFNIAVHTEGQEYLAFVGLPLEVEGKLYNVAAAVGNGYIYGLIPKMHLSDYGAGHEMRYFVPGMDVAVQVELGEDYMAPMGSRLLFDCPQMPGLKIGAELSEDLFVPDSPSVSHAGAGANLIVNLAAGAERPGACGFRRDLVKMQSVKLRCGYLFSGAGEGESTSDVLYAGQKLVAENGVILADTGAFGEKILYTEIDIQSLNHKRRRQTTFAVMPEAEGYLTINVDLAAEDTCLTRPVPQSPFFPEGEPEQKQLCREILDIQSYGIKRRFEHTHSRTAVVGISGGLDSTMALLATARAFDLMGKDRRDIIAITMPGFGTSDRTYENAVSMIHSLGATFREISIRAAVNIHFCDIEHDPGVHNVTYENAQARERTQILMDVANMENGLVIGTGDLSELCLGWATYNGDHMSNYSVNGSVPKTLMRHLVRYYADTCTDEKLSAVLYDVLDTPVSPELLPTKEGAIAQKTEDLVGPYELHDFFIYYMLSEGFGPEKIYRLARYAFEGVYGDGVILKWLQTFCRRFFMQQFKRSCAPDGPMAGIISTSPRGGLMMPSDAMSTLWMHEVEQLGETI